MKRNLHELFSLQSFTVLAGGNETERVFFRTSYFYI